MLAALLDLACPRRCPGCGERGHLLCPPCAATLRGTPFVADPSPRPAGLPPVVAASAYDGPARAALIAYKERGRVALAGPLGAALAGAVAVLGADVLIAVPSSAAARRSRGFDHVTLLARAAAARTGARVVGGLRQQRRVRDQSGLDAAARASNIAGSMAFKGRAGQLAGARILVVDDIVTSGATLTEAVRALSAAGICTSGVAVVAATRRWAPLHKPIAPG